MKFSILSIFKKPKPEKTPVITKKATKKQIAKINTLLLNIENYDGTPAGQKKIGGDIL